MTEPRLDELTLPEGCGARVEFVDVEISERRARVTLSDEDREIVLTAENSWETPTSLLVKALALYGKPYSKPRPEVLPAPTNDVPVRVAADDEGPSF